MGHTETSLFVTAIYRQVVSLSDCESHQESKQQIFKVRLFKNRVKTRSRSMDLEITCITLWLWADWAISGDYRFVRNQETDSYQIPWPLSPFSSIWHTYIESCFQLQCWKLKWNLEEVGHKVHEKDPWCNLIQRQRLCTSYLAIYPSWACLPAL